MHSSPDYIAGKIEYKDTGYFSKIILDYLDGNQFLEPFFQFPPSLHSVEAAIEQRKTKPVYRNELASALSNQYGNLLLNEHATFRNIEALKDDNTFTVVTAHQPNLLLGPLFLVYKIISAIKTAEVLNNNYPGKKFVPVYWMGSEDHDAKELNHIYLFGKKHEWITNQNGRFGKFATNELNDWLTELKSHFGQSAFAEEIYSIIHGAFHKGKTIAEATRILLHHFFGKHGLVIVDGDDINLKNIFRPVMLDELLHRNAENIVNNTTRSLSEKYDTQISPRQINLFYTGKDFRERIVYENKVWRVLNTDISFHEKELVGELHNHPEHFSPNVVLRPLYQEIILPNVIFIGGGAELSYFMQLKQVFNHYHVSYPVLLLRNSALIIDRTASEKLGKLGLGENVLFEETNALIKTFALKQAGDTINFNNEKKQFEKIFSEIKRTVTAADPSLAGMVGAELLHVEKFVASIEEKLIKAEKKKHEDSIRQIMKLKNRLFPENSLQERHENFISFYLQSGPSFFDMLFDAFNPFEKKFTIITLK